MWIWSDKYGKSDSVAVPIGVIVMDSLYGENVYLLRAIKLQQV